MKKQKDNNLYFFKAGSNKIFNYEMLKNIEELQPEIEAALKQIEKQLTCLNDFLYIHLNVNNNLIYIDLDCNTYRIDSPNKLEYYYTKPQAARVAIYSPLDQYYNRPASKYYTIGNFRTSINLNVSHVEITA